jgi:phage-related protein
MVHSFHKKTQQTPKQELEKALKRMNDFLASDTPTA